MKIPLGVLALVALLLGALWLFAPPPDRGLLEGRTDLPWQIETRADGSSRVLGLHLGHSTLRTAIDEFGPYEELVLFESADGVRSLEVWFGEVPFGLLKAKLGMSLDADQDELRTLAARAVDRKGSPTGDWKLLLSAGDRVLQEGRRLSGVTYIPSYAGLEADFFRQRLGEPAAWRELDEGGVQWFYPDKGLTLLLNAAGREVLEFVAPARFELPADARSNPTRDQDSAQGSERVGEPRG
jgi:hypothetical protein